MLRRLFTLSIVLLVFSLPAFSQKTDKEKETELKAQAVDFLKDTAGEINILRTPENRISFNAELAALMWFYDEKQARAMFGSVITDFRQMLVQIDAQINTQSFTEEETNLYSSFMRSNGAKGKLLQKLRKAMGVRQQIASAIAENDAVLGYEFFIETATAISNPKIRERYIEQDGYFEASLFEKIAEQNPVKVLELARKSLQKGVNQNIFGLLEKIYDKNNKDGAALGAEVFSKIKTMSSDDAGKLYLYNSLLELGNRKSGADGDPPLFSGQILREAADLLGSELLKFEDGEFVEVGGFLDSVEKCSPGRAVQVRQKFKLKNAKIASTNGSGGLKPVDEAFGDPNEKNADQTDELMEGFEKLGANKISDDDKQKMIGEARQKIAQIEDPSAKIALISVFAAQLSKMGDQETALQLMREAESYGSQYPKNYLDFMQNWMIAGGYAAVAPEKAFPILEDSIYRMNETISAFVKVGEFMDVNGDIIEDGEVQVGTFGGGMTKDILGNLGQANNAIEQLAKADFARTKNLANRFELTELRILARMLILRAVFSDEQKNKEIKINADAVSR